MPKYQNLRNRMVCVRLNTGATMHIAPHQISGECTEGEVQNNRMIRKLLDRRVLSVVDKAGQKPKAMSKKPKTVSARAKKK